jgi:DNA-directed RNA polymerase subunit RPC12/RpoP
MTKGDEANKKKRLVRKGYCAKCERPREPEQALRNRCLACDARYLAKLEEEVYELVPNEYAGRRPCRVCGIDFHSTDRRKVTACDACRQQQFYHADQYAGEAVLDA